MIPVTGISPNEMSHKDIHPLYSGSGIYFDIPPHVSLGSIRLHIDGCVGQNTSINPSIEDIIYGITLHMRRKLLHSVDGRQIYEQMVIYSHEVIFVGGKCILPLKGVFMWLFDEELSLKKPLHMKISMKVGYNAARVTYLECRKHMSGPKTIMNTSDELGRFAYINLVGVRGQYVKHITIRATNGDQCVPIKRYILRSSRDGEYIRDEKPNARWGCITFHPWLYFKDPCTLTVLTDMDKNLHVRIYYIYGENIKSCKLM